MNALVVPAAGLSRRMGKEKKVLLLLEGKPVIFRAVEPFWKTGAFSLFVIVCLKEDERLIAKALEPLNLGNSLILVPGGNTRQESVYHGLLALKGRSIRSVLIHDGARPFITEKLILSVLVQTEEKGSSLPVLGARYAMKETGEDGRITRHLNRQALVEAQTPQGFSYEGILKAHGKAFAEGRLDYPDDSEMYHDYISLVWSVPGDSANLKITYPDDLKGGSH